MKAYHQLIKGPIITEKTHGLKEAGNKLTLKVDVKANKIEIRQAVEALFIIPEAHKGLELSARNVPYVQVLLTAGLNVYDILRYDHLVLLSPAVAAIEERLTS